MPAPTAGRRATPEHAPRRAVPCPARRTIVVSPTAAKPRAEVYLSDVHPAPNTRQKPVEESPGTYTVGPIRFDAPGQWTVRFHFFEECADVLEESPHGHVAFLAQVP